MSVETFADDQGVWRIGSSGRPFGIPWDEIVCVSGGKLDGITEVYTCVSLDFEYGEFIELDDTMTGFPEVIEAITRRLPGIPEDWFERVSQLSKDDDTIEVWTK